MNTSADQSYFQPVFCPKCHKPYIGNPTTGVCTCPPDFMSPDNFHYFPLQPQTAMFFVSADDLRRIVAEEVERALLAHGLIGDGR